MLVIKRKKSNDELQKFLHNIVTNEQAFDRRGDERITISMAVAVVPLVAGEPQIEQAFVTFTKNISADGISIVVNKPLEYDEILIGFAGVTMSFVSATVQHRVPMPLGCYRIGLRMHSLVDASDYPALARYEKG
jgi:hypothetical protein